MFDELTDSVKELMAQRLSRLRNDFEGRNAVKPKLYNSSDKRKRNTGKLKRFIDMPLDVFLEVASSLEPLDLIYLSRVNKEFRATFMSRSARFVWTRVLESVPGLPSCPPDMTEPQYVSLIFEQLCSACESVRASKVNFTLRVRFCSACSSGNIQRGRNISPYPAWPFKESIYRLLPSKSPYATRVNDKWNLYLVSEFNLVVEDCLALRDDVPALEKLMSDREIMTVAITQHGVAVNDWYNKRQRDAKKRKDDLLTQRHDMIYAKLAELGWDSQYYPTSKYPEGQNHWRQPMDKDNQIWFNLIDQPKELTDRSWKTLCPKLEELYERLKHRKLEARANQRLPGSHILSSSVIDKSPFC